MHDYADALRKRGYEVEVYKPVNRGELRSLVEAELRERGLPVTDAAIDAHRLSDETIRQTNSFQANMKWAQKIKNEGWTVIDLGNNTGTGSLGAYYEGELRILFPNRLK